MPYERQRAIRDELNRRFPKMKGDLDRQMFRSAYYNGRMAGLDHEAAVNLSIAAVRRHVSNFRPTANLP